MAARRIATAITDGCTAPCASERNRPSWSASWGIVLFDAVLLVVGLAILAPAADQFVLGSARLSAVLNLPPVVIGTAVMGFGTSVPEMIVSSIAASGGDRALGVGNIVGSNVANLTLGLGAAAFITTMAIPNVVFRRQGPLSLLAAGMFAFFVVDGTLDRWEGVVLLAALVVVVINLITSGMHDADTDADSGDLTFGVEALRAVGGLVGTMIAAQMVVVGARGLADEFSVSGGFVGFSLVALGTSLPELVTVVACARRAETGLIVGNLLGSNIFNALAVSGVMGVVSPGMINDESLTGLGLAVMLAVAIGAFIVSFIGRKVSRIDGAVLLALYFAATMLLASSAIDADDDYEADPTARVVEAG